MTIKIAVPLKVLEILGIKPNITKLSPFVCIHNQKKTQKEYKHQNVIQ